MTTLNGRRIKRRLKQVGRFAKKHFVDASAGIAFATPMYGAFETLVQGLPIEDSMNARVISAQLGYLGMGSLYAYGRDRWKLKFLKTEASKLREGVTEASYTAVWCGLFSPPIYYSSGVHDWPTVGISTLISVGVGIASGYFIGRYIDTFRELTNIPTVRETPLLPAYVRGQHDVVKSGLAALLFGVGTLGATAFVYSLK